MSNLILTGSRQVSDLSLEISKGAVTGHSAVNKFGANLSVTADTTEDVWDGGGTYSFPATALITKVSQKVNQAAMVGATINVQGLDANWALVIQDVALDGADTTTPVVLTTPLIRAFRMKVMANIVGDQIISAHNTANNLDYAIITAGNNQTLMAIYTVPAGKTAYMTGLFFSNIDATAKTPTSTTFKLWAADRANSYEFQLKHMDAIPEAGNGRQHSFNPYYKFTEKTDIKVSASPLDQDASVHSGFDLILIDN